MPQKEKLGKVWYVLRHGNTTPKKLRTFHQALQDLLGANVHAMEKLIANDLCRRFELSFKSHDGWTITDHANHAEVKKHG